MSWPKKQRSTGKNNGMEAMEFVSVGKHANKKQEIAKSPEDRNTI